MKKLLVLFMFSLLLLPIFQVSISVKAEPGTIRVPQDYPTIQEAINAASDGDTVIVAEGVYDERILIGKTLKLIGENRNSIINASSGGDVVTIFYAGVTISGFTITSQKRYYYSTIKIENSKNCNITDNTIVNNNYAITMAFSDNNEISGNTISASYYGGIQLNRCNNNTIAYNNMSYWGGHITIGSSNCNNITGNDLSDDIDSIGIVQSAYNILRDNKMGGLVVRADTDELLCFIQDIDTSNTVNGKPVYYLINQSNTIINPSTVPEIGYLGLINSTNITVENINITRYSDYPNYVALSQGMLLAYTEDSTINQVNVSTNYISIDLFKSHNNNILDSTIFDSAFGIRLESSEFNIIANSNITSCLYDAIWFETAKYNALNNNNISYGFGGLVLTAESEHNIVSNNTMFNIMGYEVPDYPGYPGAISIDSKQNFVFHNNFIDNTIQVYVKTSQPNTWDFQSRGNYWSDYTGDDTNADGIGDTPYVIDANNQDNYPLMSQYTEDERNLAPNPSFEKGTLVPDGWTYYPYNDGTAFLWDRDLSHSGSFSVGVANISNPWTIYGWYTSQPVPVNANKTYTFSVWYKWMGVPAFRQFGDMGINEYAENGTWVGGFGRELNYYDDGEWHFLELECSLNQSTSYVRLELDQAYTESSSDAQVRFDDVFFGLSMGKEPAAFLSAFPTTVVEDTEEVGFDASSSYDADGSIVSYWYDYGDGHNSDWVGEPIHYRKYLDQGEYFASVRVKDNDGLVSKWSNYVKIIVKAKDEPENKPPMAFIDTISPNPSIEGDTVYFEGHATDEDGSIVEYSWLSSIDGLLSSSNFFSTSSLSVGTHTILFNAKDNDSAWGHATATLTVKTESEPENKPPVAYIDIIEPNPAREKETVTFQGHGEDTDGNIVEYRWESDKDGFLSSQKSFGTAGLSVNTHTISFKVKDDDMDWSQPVTVTLRIEVGPTYDWAAILKKAELRREIYECYNDLFDSGWWHEVAMDQIDPIERLFNPLDYAAGELFDLLVEYFTNIHVLGPISILDSSYDISKGLVDLFQAIYYDEVAGTLGGAYANHNIRTDISALLDAVGAVILAVNEHDATALNQALSQEKQATENAYVGTKRFDNAINQVLEGNPIWSDTTRTRIYLELRGYLIGLHSSLEESYAYLTQELGEFKDLAREISAGKFTARYNLPTVASSYWQVGDQRVTVAEVGQKVTVVVVLSTAKVSRTDSDMVHGTITISVKKDKAFLPDEIYAENSFEVTIGAGQTERLSFSFIPDQKSSLWMRGYFLEVQFRGDYMIAGIVLENRFVQWFDGGYQMQSSYPPRLKVSEAGSISLSGILIRLDENQHKLYLHIYDAEGGHVGINHETNQHEMNIPEAQYFDLENGTIIIILPPSQADYTIAVDAKYAADLTETYSLKITAIENEQTISQEEITSTIQKGSSNQYALKTTLNGEISLNENEITQFPLWIYAVATVLILGSGATLIIWRMRRKHSATRVEKSASQT